MQQNVKPQFFKASIHLKNPYEAYSPSTQEMFPVFLKQAVDNQNAIHKTYVAMFPVYVSPYKMEIVGICPISAEPVTLIWGALNMIELPASEGTVEEILYNQLETSLKQAFDNRILDIPDPLYHLNFPFQIPVNMPGQVREQIIPTCYLPEDWDVPNLITDGIDEREPEEEEGINEAEYEMKEDYYWEDHNEEEDEDEDYDYEENSYENIDDFLPDPDFCAPESTLYDDIDSPLSEYEDNLPTTQASFDTQQSPEIFFQNPLSGFPIPTNQQEREPVSSLNQPEKIKTYPMHPFFSMPQPTAATFKHTIKMFPIGKADSDIERRILSFSKENHYGESFAEEIRRIFGARTIPLRYGNPVHYILTWDQNVDQRKMEEILMGSLFQKRRLLSRRYTRVVCNYQNLSTLPWKQLYNSCGAALIVNYIPAPNNSSQNDNANLEAFQTLAVQAELHQHDVLTVVCIPTWYTHDISFINKAMKNLTFVKLGQELLSPKESKQYLEEKLFLMPSLRNRKLEELTNAPNKCYEPQYLNQEFDKWLSARLRGQDVYSQYNLFHSVAEKANEESGEGQTEDARQELTQLVGLEKAKKMVEQILNTAWLKREALLLGAERKMPSLHMCFTGNPGTAKTTVARLLAGILREMKVLPVGKLVEVGRADLVAPYVGQTAPMVKKAFQRAKGSVLFIDEAYSLVDDRSGMFGDEAINTIVQEMENNRDDTLVIFAGYPDKMEWFLQKNEGLRSRISFHVPFEDYSPKELLQILKLMAKQKNLKLESNIPTYVKEICQKVCHQRDFGNGRFIRNLLEHAEMCQANRLANNSGNHTPSVSDILTLKKQDFVGAYQQLINASHEEKGQQRSIGFLG